MALDAAAELTAGRVGRPHGLDGSFHVVDPVPALLPAGGLVNVAGRARRIVRRAGTDARPIVRLDGCEDREAAEALRGRRLTVPRDHAPVLEEGEFWADELVGCTVVTARGRALGDVRRMLALPSCEVLELDDPAGTLVPMVRDAIRSVDVQARRIEVDEAFLGV